MESAVSWVMETSKEYRIFVGNLLNNEEDLGG
jgi:hypothetical protein